MSDAEHTFVCVSRQGVIVPTPEGGSRTLREGDEVEGEYYEQIFAVQNALMRKSEMSKKMVETITARREAREDRNFPKKFKAAMDEGAEGRDVFIDPHRKGVVETLRGAVQDAVGSVRTEETASKESASEKSESSQETE